MLRYFDTLGRMSRASKTIKGLTEKIKERTRRSGESLKKGAAR